MDIASGFANACPNTLEGAPLQLFLTLINSLMTAKCQFDTKEQYPKDSSKNLKNDDEFDFIIVGAGSAGSVITNRLSAVTNWKILLIEAGSYPSARSEMPFMSFNIKDTEEDWKYTAQPSKQYCYEFRGKVCACPRGKGLGGSSLINTLLYLRSTKNDHNQWVQEGNSEWDYDSVVKYYKRFENVQTNDEYYGKKGELKINRHHPEIAVIRAIKDAYTELGYDEYTEDKPIGHNAPLRTIAKGTRQSAAKAFLRNLKDQKNLFLALNSQVSKLLFDQNTRSVVGVEVKVNNKIKRFRTRKEVILSAGSINSPQILLNSGIGPPQQLEPLGIRVIQDLPVGKNLQDHIAYYGYYADVKVSPELDVQPEANLTDNLYQYFMHKSGPLSYNSKYTSGYINTKNNSNYANTQIHYFVYNKGETESMKLLIEHHMLPEAIAKTILEHNKKSPTFVAVIVMLKPKSKGYIKLKNNDLFSKPIIVPNYFSEKDNETIKVLVDAIKATNTLLKTRSLSPFALKYIDLEPSGCKDKARQSDDFWECAVRSFSSTLYHPVGTCKMGPERDPSAVVDQRLRVHGVKGLRVIDGSIMPVITSCNTNAPIIMIGEKGAEMVKEDWFGKSDEPTVLHLKSQ